MVPVAAAPGGPAAAPPQLNPFGGNYGSQHPVGYTSLSAAAANGGGAHAVALQPTAAPPAAAPAAAAVGQKRSHNLLEGALPAGIGSEAMRARLSNLMQEVDTLAKKDAGLSRSLAPPAASATSLEQLTSANREQANHIHTLTETAAKREAAIGQMQARRRPPPAPRPAAPPRARSTPARRRLSRAQAQLAQAQVVARQIQEGAQAERQRLTQQHHATMMQAQQQLEESLAGAARQNTSLQELLHRLVTIIVNTNGWLHRLAQRCASQSVRRAPMLEPGAQGNPFPLPPAPPAHHPAPRSHRSTCRPSASTRWPSSTPPPPPPSSLAKT